MRLDDRARDIQIIQEDDRVRDSYMIQVADVCDIRSYKQMIEYISMGNRVRDIITYADQMRLDDRVRDIQIKQVDDRVLHIQILQVPDKVRDI